MNVGLAPGWWPFLPMGLAVAFVGVVLVALYYKHSRLLAMAGCTAIVVGFIVMNLRLR